MQITKKVFLVFVLLFAACGSQSSKANETVDFDDILDPHYTKALTDIACDEWQSVSIPVFDQQDQILSFQHKACFSNPEHEMVDFQYKSKFLGLENYIIGKYKIVTPKSAFKINPNADQFTYLDVPIFGIAKLNGTPPKTYFNNGGVFRNIDWNVCKIKKRGKHIFELENPSFKEIPEQNYTIDKYASFKDWQKNHEADKAKYRQLYGAQNQKNRACGRNEPYWFVAKGDILITIPNPANFTGGVNPMTISIHKND